ncbi:serine protease HTRA2, mitochondrial-like [Sitophilus oryzae]|uniref:Serine protease HTRA2, mitochondrial n=1 Tax=Sitophilus oryzae TaxID=7048 RepID=A0A6J2YBU1_SITOR|nr:serine protease HTRA2, mitochondrial-like [Sitophilus oryzae]
MSSYLTKIPTICINKNFPKVLSIKSYTSDGKNKGSGSQDNKEPPKITLNKLNLFGTVGIASALLASYFLVRKTQDKGANFLDTVTFNNVKIPEQHVLRKSPSEDFEEKDEHLREQYNFIKKVVNDCAGAVFYLELRDPNLRDPETQLPMIMSNGSGFIISEDGWALTNAHVVLNKPHTTITAIMRDGRSYNVKVEDADMNIDLALLKLETEEKLPSLEFGEPGDTDVGEWVVALGSPLSLSNSVTVGIVSCINRPAEELGLKNYSMTYIQTDASITFGNSGGPLVNLDGNVIGINNLRLTSGISFAIPIEYVRKFLMNTKYRMENMARSTKGHKTLFGLTTIPITPDLLDDLKKDNSNLPKDITHGLLVWKIIPETPAEKGGLEVGDIITHVNGIPIEKPAQLYDFSSSRSSIDVEIINRGQKKTVVLKMEEK